MFRNKKRFVLPCLVLLCALAFWLAFHGAGMLVQRRMAEFLARHGIGEAVITSFGHGSGGQIIFSDIRLDPDGFSTIGEITARVRWPFLLSSRPFSEIIIEKLALTGEMDADGNITIAGLKPATLSPLAETDSLILNSGQVDLSTPVGAIRLELKNRMTRQPDGSQKFVAALWGNQFQLELDTRWNGQIFPNGKWNVSTEIREARLGLPHLSISRMNGWLAADGALQGISTLSGQIEAGRARLGEKTAVSDASITVDGPFDSSHIILHGNVSTYKDMVVTADMKRAGDTLEVHASVEAKKIDDLISFLQNLHGDIQLAMPRSTALTTLLLTPGNLERIRTAAGNLTYDLVELVIDGTAGSLTGRIVMRWNGGAETGVININPGQ